MKSVMCLLLGALLLVGCAKPPEQVYNHPKTGQVNLIAHLSDCGETAERFGIINMSPVHQYSMPDMKDRFQREKVFKYCMRKKGYEEGDSIAIIIDEDNTAISFTDTVLAVGETSKVTILFGSAVGGLEIADFTVENGVLSDIQTDDAGLTWTALFTPTPGLEDRKNVVRLNNAGVIDSVSNLGSGITLSDNYVIDTLPPTVQIGITPLSPTVPTEASIPVDSDMPTEASIPVDSDMPTEASIPVDSDMPTEASIPVDSDMPTEASIPVDSDIPTEASIPVDSDVPTEASIPVDSDIPAEASLPFESDSPALVTLPANFTDEDIYAVNIHQTSRINFTFSEPPRHFSRSDISVVNGTVGKLVRDDKTHYHAIFTAASDFRGQGQVTVKASRFTDMASNENEPATPAIVAIDTLRPTITASLDNADGLIR